MTARSQDKRFWLGGGALAAIVLAAVTWLAVIGPARTTAADHRQQAAAALDQNAVLQAQIGKLKKQQGDLVKLTARLNKAVTALPYETGLPAFTRQISRQARSQQVSIGSIVVGAMTAVAGTATTTVPAATTPATTATVAPASVLAIAITLVSTGRNTNQLALLHHIQVTGPRRALVQSTLIAPVSVGSPNTLMTTQLTVFTAPLSAAAQAQLQKLLHGDVTG